MDSYLQLIQIAAVTAVACVLIVGAAGDMFDIVQATNSKGQPQKEPGTGNLVHIGKYTSSLSRRVQIYIQTLSWFIALAYTALLLPLIYSIIAFPHSFPVEELQLYFGVAVSITIIGVSWLTLAVSFVRRERLKLSTAIAA